MSNKQTENQVCIYRKVPVKIKAIKWTGDNIFAVKEFTNYTVNNWSDDHLTINTLEGPMIADLGDYIIQGVKGEFYPCKPDIFKRTYEKLNAFDQVIDFD